MIAARVPRVALLVALRTGSPAERDCIVAARASADVVGGEAVVIDLRPPGARASVPDAGALTPVADGASVSAAVLGATQAAHIMELRPHERVDDVRLRQLVARTDAVPASILVPQQSAASQDSDALRVDLLSDEEPGSAPLLWRRDLLASLAGQDVPYPLRDDRTSTVRGLAAAPSLASAHSVLLPSRAAAPCVASRSDAPLQARWVTAEVDAWRAAEQAAQAHGVSFVKVHGPDVVAALLHRLIWSGGQLSDADFRQLATFSVDYQQLGSDARLPHRYRELLSVASGAGRDAFAEALRPRLAVAGHDLKFLKELLPLFAKRFDVRIDKWSGHNVHSVGESERLLAWADLVWAEWMLGAAVWYSQRVHAHQHMVIRAHRSELTVDFGLQVRFDAVDTVIAIAPRILGDFADRFDIPRSKLTLVPNALAVDDYRVGTSPERLNHIALIGAVPKLKGLDRAIRLTADLRRDLPDLQLHVFGKRPEEYEWLMRRPAERAYFAECEQLLDELGVRDAVHFDGWVETHTAVSEMAAVISMSEFEGMQVAVAEGFLGGGVGMTLHWRGAEQGYPRSCVFETESEMRQALLKVLRDSAELEQRSAEGRELISRLYGVDRIWERLRQLIDDFTAAPRA